jgi:hypothetical protein
MNCFFFCLPSSQLCSMLPTYVAAYYQSKFRNILGLLVNVGKIGLSVPVFLFAFAMRISNKFACEWRFASWIVRLKLQLYIYFIIRNRVSCRHIEKNRKTTTSCSTTSIFRNATRIVLKVDFPFQEQLQRQPAGLLGNTKLEFKLIIKTMYTMMILFLLLTLDTKGPRKK